MFCSHCGSSVKEKDKFCCACGNNIDNMSATSKNIDQSGCSTSHLNFMSQQGVIGCAGMGQNVKPLSFDRFLELRESKEQERQKGFTRKRKGTLKRSDDVDITVGLLRWNGEDYVKPRFIGSNVVVTVAVDSTAEMIVAAAAVRHKLHNIKFPEIAYKLLYSDGSIVNKIPGTDVTFTLQRYKQFLRKPYSKITLYLAPADQEATTILNRSDDDEEENISDQQVITASTSSTSSSAMTLMQSSSRFGDSDSDFESLGTPTIKLRKTTATTTSTKLTTAGDSIGSDSSLFNNVGFDNHEIQLAITNSLTEQHLPPVSVKPDLSSCNGDDLHSDTNNDIEITSQSSLDLETFSEDTMTDILKKLKRNIDSDGKRNIVNVDRTGVLEGGLRAFSRSTFMPRNSLSVRFTSEDGVDSGGLTREFTRLALLQLKQSSLFTGTDTAKNITLDYNALKKNKYQSAGKLIAYSLVHNGQIANFFSELLYNLVTTSTSEVSVGIDNVDDPVLKQSLQMILDAENDETFFTAIEPLLELIDLAGCSANCRNSSSRHCLVQGLAYFSVVGRCTAAIDQFKDGLETLGVLAEIQKHPEVMQPAFIHSVKMLDATMVDELFHITERSRANSNNFNIETVVITNWRNFLQDMEESGQLSSLLIFATGYETIPPCGFDIQPSITFRHNVDSTDPTRCYPIADTCTNTIKLPIMQSYDQFAANMLAAVNMPLTFSRQ